MRPLSLLVVLALCVPGPALAQEWETYVSRDDRFSITFPGEPLVEEITWPSEYGAVFQGRVYSVEQGASRFSVTAIDYTDAEARHAEVTKNASFAGAMYWRIDIMASIQYAATKFRQREGSTVTYDAWHYIDLVEGHQLQLINADRSLTFVAIYLHENRLYIVEGTVPRNAPPPGLFQQNLSFLDEAGERVRHDEIYSNALPPVTQQQGGPGAAGNFGGGGGGASRGPQ
jgi:hypothetical protein